MPFGKWLLGALPGLISTGAGVANSILNRRQSERNLTREINYSREAADTQHNRNIELWRMQTGKDLENWHLANTYNAPVNQMARLKEAGINPRLIYGSGGATGGMASAVKTGTPSSYKYNVPNFSQAKAFQLPDGIGSYMDLKIKQAQVDAIEQQTSLNAQREANEAVETAIKTREKQSANRYYWNRSWKMHEDRRIASAKLMQQEDLAAISQEVAKEKLSQARIDTQQRAAALDLTTEQIVAQKLKNEYERKGLSPNSPYEAKLLYQELKHQGMNDRQIAATLLMTGVGASAMKHLLPAGIIGSALKTVKKRKVDLPKPKKARYGGSENWRRLQRKMDIQTKW